MSTMSELDAAGINPKQMESYMNKYPAMELSGMMQAMDRLDHVGLIGMTTLTTRSETWSLQPQTTPTSARLQNMSYLIMTPSPAVLCPTGFMTTTIPEQLIHTVTD